VIGPRLAHRLRTLRRDDRGTAAIEFALWSSILFVVMMVALDFAMFRVYQLRLGAAVEQGAMLSFNNREKLDDLSAISTYVRSAAALPGPAVSVQVSCNSTTAGCVSKAAGRSCTCIGGATPTFTAATCGASCAGGSTAGYYMILKATYTYSPVVIPNRWLNNRTMTERAVLRLQ